MSNFFVQELVLYRHFMLIDSPIPFELVANPTNYRKDEHGNVLNTDISEITGRDICSRPAGAWRVDCWTLLPEKYHKQNPVFTMLIKYDRDLLDEGEEVDIRYSDIDIGEGVAGVNGQLVDIPASAFRPVVQSIESASASLGGKLDEHSDYLASISDDVSAIRTDVVDISNDTSSMKSNVGDMSLDVSELVRLLGSLDNGTVLNELEQIRTVLKSPSSAGASSPWGSILLKLRDIVPSSAYWSFSSFRNEAESGFYEGIISVSFNSTTYYICGRFLVRHSVSRFIFSVNTVCCDSSNNFYPCMFRSTISSDTSVSPSGDIIFNGNQVSITSILGVSLRSVL